MALTQFTNLNFEDIKTSIKDYLRQNSNFTDFDFEGSNLSIIINLLAYNSYITAYNTNMAVNETFIDSATLRENVVSLARNIGYVPRSVRSARAQTQVFIDGLGSDVESITIQPGLISNSSINDVNYLFSLPEKVTLSVEDGAASDILEIYQGQYLKKEWTVNDSLPNQRYILPNDGIDTTTLRVSVKENDASTTKTDYKLVDNIIGITSESNIFLIQETTDEKYEILFGDGVFGKKLESGNVVSAEYIKTDGKSGNGASEFRFLGALEDQDGASILTFESQIFTANPSEGGDDIESVESVRYYAPRMYSSQHRAVTANDYEAILPSLYPNIESVTAFGGEDLNPPQYGRVFIAAKPRNGAYLSDYTKNEILGSLKSYSVAGIVPVMIDLQYLFVEIDSCVYYNENFVGNPDNVRTDIIAALTQYANSSEINQFGSRFKYSKVQTIIDGVDTSITSNITTVRMRRNLRAQINQFSQYELCFDNEMYRQKSKFNIKSTGFTVEGISGTVYLSDMNGATELSTAKSAPMMLVDKDGTVISSNVGKVKYDVGEILLDTINITSTEKPQNIVEIQAIPMSNDVLARKDLYLQFDISNSNITMKQDSIASGGNTSGTRFQPQSSYQNGQVTR
jgi:hypothetical protein|tara:strand:- start:21615 stop:23495 length:1881 start_codon:yes stop_codon:yes gene_type:complete